METPLIQAGWSFGALHGQYDPQQQASYLAAYQAALAHWQQLPQEAAIFLDTNVLLGYYQWPLVAQQAFDAFLKERAAQVYCCYQVRMEFKRHVAKLYHQYWDQAELPWPTERQQGLPEQLADFQDAYGDVLTAYPNFKQRLQAETQQVQQCLIQVAQLKKQRLKAVKKHLRKQDVRPLVDSLQQLPPLKHSEIAFLKAEFDELKTDALAYKAKHPMVDSLTAYLQTYPEAIFPGLADIAQKAAQPYGDYLIYHELMKWAKGNPTEQIIWLTNDITKRDWLQVNYQVYPHYIENFYRQTGQLLYMFPATPLLEQQFNTSFEPCLSGEERFEDAEAHWLVQYKESKVDKLSPKALRAVLKQVYANREVVEADPEFWTSCLQDLEAIAGITTAWELKVLLLEYYPRVLAQELEQLTWYDQVEVLEATLSLAFGVVF